MKEYFLGRKWLLLGLFWFLLIAILGLTMRYLVIAYIAGLNYKNIMHAHSHVALLGWVYTALMVGIIEIYFDSQYTKFKSIFLFTQVTILGMFISFPFQGYAFFSISFSTLFLFASYWFIWKVFKSISNSDRDLVSTKFLKASMWYLAISSIGPWSLGPIMATGHIHQPIYYNAIYFFLHFLYNGFIVMAIMSIVYKYIEQNKILNHYGKWTYLLLQLSIIPSYALSTYWTYNYTILYLIGGASALVLFLSLFPFLKDIKSLFKYNISSKWVYYILALSIVSYILKVVFQLSSSYPTIADSVYQNSKYLIIGYLHLVLLGFVSLFLISWFIHRGLFSIRSAFSKLGIVFLVGGIISSEALLFYNGANIWIELPSIPNFHRYLLFGSSPIFVGLVLFYIGQFYRENNK